MQNQSKRDALVQEYLQLRKKIRECTDEKKKKELIEKATIKHDEIIMNDMGRDKNFKRFSY